MEAPTPGGTESLVGWKKPTQAPKEDRPAAGPSLPRPAAVPSVFTRSRALPAPRLPRAGGQAQRSPGTATGQRSAQMWAFLTGRPDLTSPAHSICPSPAPQPLTQGGHQASSRGVGVASRELGAASLSCCPPVFSGKPGALSGPQFPSVGGKSSSQHLAGQDPVIPHPGLSCINVPLRSNHQWAKEAAPG